MQGGWAADLLDASCVWIGWRLVSEIRLETFVWLQRKEELVFVQNGLDS